MLFESNFEVLEIHDSGVKITHLMRGKRKDIKRDIEMFKKNSKDYMMVGKKFMIVWA